MNRAIRFSLILACLLAGLASASFANIVVDGAVEFLNVGGVGLTGTPTEHGDWVVSGTGKAVGATTSGSGNFVGISSGAFTLTAEPYLTSAGNTHFPANGSYQVTVFFSNSTHVSLQILVNGVSIGTGIASGTTTDITVSNFAASNIQLKFSGNSTANDFSLQSVNIVAVANVPEPKSTAAAALLIGLVGCTERRRLGRLMSTFIGRCARFFS